MKKTTTLLLIVSIFSASLPSCANVKGNGWSYLTLGTDVKMINVTADGMSSDEINQSTAFKDVTKLVNLMWRSYIVGKLIQYVSGKYYDYQNKIVNQETVVNLEKLRNAKSVNDANAALATLKETNRAAEAIAVIPK